MLSGKVRNQTPPAWVTQGHLRCFFLNFSLRILTAVDEHKLYIYHTYAEFLSLFARAC